MKSSKAVILVGHGSRVPGFERDMRRAVEALQKELGKVPVRPAYLEINSPSLAEAIDASVLEGAASIFILPYFLLVGRHVLEDIPRIAREASERHGQKANIVVCPYLGFDVEIVDVLLRRLQSAV